MRRKDDVVIPVERFLTEDISTGIFCTGGLHSLTKQGTRGRPTGEETCQYKPQFQAANVICKEKKVMAFSMDTVNVIGLYLYFNLVTGSESITGVVAAVIAQLLRR
jgi:hypothetical protein